MAEEPKADQEWAWNYFRHRLGTIAEFLELSENLPKITTFSDLGEGVLFIRFPWFRVENDELVFKNTELYRKVRAIRYVDGPGGCYSAMRIISGLLQEIPDNEPVIVVK